MIEICLKLAEGPSHYIIAGRSVSLQMPLFSHGQKSPIGPIASLPEMGSIDLQHHYYPEC